MVSTRATKIVATLGPSSDSPEIVRELMGAGADVFRLNASYGSAEAHAVRIRLVRRLAKETGRHVGILLDLQGPKIRLGSFVGGQAILQAGARFVITTLPILGTAERVSTTYENLARDVSPGDHVLLADGAVELRVAHTDGVSVTCHVVSAGKIGDSKGINLPGVRVTAPALTDKDIRDLEFGIAQGIDYVALSFVRSAEDVRQLLQRLNEVNANVPVIAKIEKPEAWNHLEDILEVSDGVMVARGDLGIETALEYVPTMQKSIIEAARRRGRVVITATQMLESMIDHPAPTRAEVSDVANAVYDGTDALMLSAETARGKFPVESVRMMAGIAAEAESNIRKRGFASLPETSQTDHAHIIAEAAFHAAHSARVAALVVFTASGFSARLIARYRPPVPIHAFAPQESVTRRLALVYGTIPVLAPKAKSTDEMLKIVERILIETGRLKTGDDVVFVAGQPDGATGSTNLIKLHSIGSPQPVVPEKCASGFVAAIP